MAVYNMAKPKPKPVQYGGPQKPPSSMSEVGKPGYGNYTRPQEPAKPKPSGGPLSAMSPSAASPAQPAPQPFQYQNTTGAPLSFQEQMRQRLNSMGAQLPAPQPTPQANALDQSRMAAQQQMQDYSQQVGALGSAIGAQKPPQQDYSKPAQVGPQMPPAQAGAEVGYQGQANFGPPQQTTPVVGSGTPVGAGYGGFYGGGGGGIGLGQSSGLSRVLNDYLGLGNQTLPGSVTFRGY